MELNCIKEMKGGLLVHPLPRYRDKLDIADKVLYVRYFSPEMFSLVEMIVFVPLEPVVKFIACWLSSRARTRRIGCVMMGLLMKLSSSVSTATWWCHRFSRSRPY